MKRKLILNRKLSEYELFEQNKYFGNKINSIKPTIKSHTTFKSKYNHTHTNNNYYSKNKCI